MDKLSASWVWWSLACLGWAWMVVSDIRSGSLGWSFLSVKRATQPTKFWAFFTVQNGLALAILVYLASPIFSPR